jgi:hypothetical protein
MTGTCGATGQQIDCVEINCRSADLFADEPNEVVVYPAGTKAFGLM